MGSLLLVLLFIESFQFVCNTNECSIEISSCGWDNSECVNKNGDFSCTCISGWHLNEEQKSCADIDECSSYCKHENATCKNLNGSFDCLCPIGWSFNLPMYHQEIMDCIDIHLLLREVFLDIKAPDSTFAPLKQAEKFPSNPDAYGLIKAFDIPPSNEDNFCQRVRGWLKAAQTGSYIFYSKCNDYCELYLSTDAHPANKKKILADAKHPYSSSAILWSEGSSLWNLTAGHSYYIEALTCDVDGTDYLSVGMQKYGTEEFSQTPITTTFFSEMRLVECNYNCNSMKNEICVNENGTYRICTCENGYKYGFNTSSCEDINECLNKVSPCLQNNTQCVNQDGSFACPCQNGWVLDAENISCVVSTLPMFISVDNQEKQKLNLKWMAPRSSSGVILGYLLCYEQLSMDRVEGINICIEIGNVTAYNITKLDKYSNYRIQLLAENTYGRSAPAIFSVFTQQDVPTNVQNVSSLSYPTDTSIFVKWNTPINVYGILRGYTVYYKKGLQEGLNSTFFFTQCNHTKNETCLIDNLSPYTNYTIKILVENDVESNSISLTIATIASVPPNFTDALPTVGANEITESTFTITLIHFSEINGPIRDYHVIVKKLDSPNPLLITPASYSNKDIQRNLDGIYLAGIISDKSKKTFLVGSGSISKRKKRETPIIDTVVQNPLLASETYYTVFLRGYVSDSVFQTTRYYNPVKTAKNPTNNVSSVTVGVAVGVGILLLVFIGTVSYCILCRYRKKISDYKERIANEERKRKELEMKQVPDTYQPVTSVDLSSYVGLRERIFPTEENYECITNEHFNKITEENSSHDNGYKIPRTDSLVNPGFDEENNVYDYVNDNYLELK